MKKKIRIGVMIFGFGRVFKRKVVKTSNERR